MSMSALRNPMQANAGNLIGLDTEIILDEKCDPTVKVHIAEAHFTEVINELESTDFTSLDHLPPELEKRKAAYAGLLNRLSSENGKHYIILDPAYSRELADYINQNEPDYTNTLANNKNLLFSHLGQAVTFQGLAPNEYQMDCLHELNEAESLMIAEFQKSKVSVLRPSLPETQVVKKGNDRYSAEALAKKSKSGKILLYVVKQDLQIIATMVINLHSLHTPSQLDKAMYMSDMMADREHMLNGEFIQQFMVSVMNDLARRFSPQTILTYMAPGIPSDPLVICTDHLKKIGLAALLNLEAQKNLGLITYFVQKEKNRQKFSCANTPANLFYHTEGNMTHYTSQEEEKMSTLSLFDK